MSPDVTLDDVLRRAGTPDREADEIRKAAAFLLATPTISVGDAVVTAPGRSMRHHTDVS